MTSLFKIENQELTRIPSAHLSEEALIESWVEKDIKLIGIDAVVIGRQVSTAYGGRIDILALDRDGNIVIVELKKDKTPRDIVAQLLDYASWVRTLKAPEINEIAERYNSGKRIDDLYRDCFSSEIPEKMNTSHSMWIIASEADEATKRIVGYLSEEYGVVINTAFFRIHGDDGQKFLTTDYLLEQEEVKARSERRNQLPWSGYYYVNVAISKGSSYWPDMKEYGYVAAGGSEVYTKPLDKLQVGDKIFAYQKDRGYVGYGIITSEKQLASEFMLKDGSSLFLKNLKEPTIKEGDDDRQFYVVGVDWSKTFDIEEAKTYKNIFANQNIVCQLNHEKTLEFLKKEFDVPLD